MLRPARLVKLYCFFPKKSAGVVAERLQDIGLVHLFDIKEEDRSLRPLAAASRKESGELKEKLKKYLAGMKKEKPLEMLIGPGYVELGKKKDAELIGEAKSLVKEIEKSGDGGRKRLYSRVLSVAESLEDLEKRLDAMEKFGSTQRTASFACFVKEENVPDVTNTLDAVAKGKFAFEVKKAGDKAPTLLDNAAIVKPFEILTESYGMPPYNGFDPTLLLAVTFTLFFGIMFPDAGYGAVIAAMSALAYYITRKASRFARNLNIILVYCGLSSVVFGLFFGELFGVKIQPILFEPTRDLIAIFLISIIIGIVHLSASLASRAAVEKEKIYSLSVLAALWSAVLFAYSREMIYLGLFAAAFAVMLHKKGFYAAKDIAGIFTRILSYLRIGILSIAHISVSRVFVNIAISAPKTLEGVLLAAFLIVIGVSLSFAIGVAVVFLQSLRLEWLEFFGELEMGGTKFEPFRRRKEYLY
ncbi:MAG: hypothetical protein HYW26_06035 [Candidatus Aenigmarchaeota archaeon]|nr:hypothetical protein [Candidatus Aenigmarchaeota archaeon]